MTSPALARSPLPAPANFTRRTKNLPRQFFRDGRWHLLLLYHVLQWSDLTREGIERSGSYRFADHLYRNIPSGRGWLGRRIDRIALDMPASRAMRQRYLRSIEEMSSLLDGRTAPLRVLALPCGIPRDISELVAQHPHLAKTIHYTAMDIDPEVLQAATDHLSAIELGSKQFHHGNALDTSTWPHGPFDLIISTGLGEFLDDTQLQTFYAHVKDHLAPGGSFYTSATAWEKRSDFLLKAFELRAHYRDRAKIDSLFKKQTWSTMAFDTDPTGLQTFIRATV